MRTCQEIYFSKGFNIVIYVRISDGKAIKYTAPVLGKNIYNGATNGDAIK